MATQTTKTTGYGTRLRNSFKAIASGFLMLIGGTVLIFWNEGRTIKMTKDIIETEKQTIQVDNISTVDPALNGKIIYAWGNATTEEIVSDGVFGIKDVAIKVTRKVEYYQMVENQSTETKDKIGGGQEEITTYTYEEKWVPEPINSSKFIEVEQQKKNITLAKVENATVFAPNVMLGGYTLPQVFKSQIGTKTPLSINLSEDEIKSLAKRYMLIYDSRSATNTQYVDTTKNDTVAVGSVVEKVSGAIVNLFSTFHVISNVIYMGEKPISPEIGDVRITFEKYVPCEVSIVAKVVGNTFEEHTGKNGNKVSIIQNGKVSMESMFESAHKSNMLWAWGLRILGVLLIIGGFKGIFSILEALSMVLPFLGRIVGGVVGVVCFILGLAWALIVFAIAWIFYRPLLGIGLLLAAGVLIYYLIMRNKSKKEDIVVDTPK